MRIAGYIEHPYLKITIFQMENKYAVKLEDATLEQNYKFRKGPGLESVADVRAVIDDRFIKRVLEQMKVMRRLQIESLQRMKEEDDEFDEII